jgi:hypothetical protein
MEIKRPVLFPDEHSEDKKKDKKKPKIKKETLFIVKGEKKNNNKK